MKIFLIICLSFFINSCFVSDDFRLNNSSFFDKSIYALKMNGFNTAEKINENSFIISDTGMVALAYATETQFMIDFGVVFDNNPKFDIFLRTTPQDYIDGYQNIRIELDSEDESISFIEGEKILKTMNYKFYNETKRFKIYNYEKKIKVSIDCDDIFEYKTELALTEYIIFRNNKLDSLEINAVSVVK